MTTSSSPLSSSSTTNTMVSAPPPSETSRAPDPSHSSKASTDEELPIINGNGIHDPSPLRALAVSLNTKVQRFLNEEAPTELLKKVQEQTRVALGVVGEALERYSLDEISLSYNGGKDCLVLLILFLASLSSYPRPLPPSLPTVYIISPHPFAEIDEFVDYSVSTYHLDLARYAMPMKLAFEKYLQDMKTKRVGKGVKAIFVGTRRTDPHGALLTHFDKTDGGWPDFVRVHPVIDWHYVEIWAFIRHLQIPYCKLYDLGYTSLGGTTDTHPNPALKAADGGQESFKPAYELVEDKAERLGRDF